MKAESPAVCCRPHPMAARPSTFADEVIEKRWPMAAIGTFRTWRDVRYESVMRSIADFGYPPENFSRADAALPFGPREKTSYSPFATG